MAKERPKEKAPRKLEKGQRREIIKFKESKPAHGEDPGPRRSEKSK